MPLPPEPAPLPPEPAPPADAPFVSIGAFSAMAITVLAGMAQMLFFTRVPHLWPMLLGTIYLVLGTFGWIWAERRRSRVPLFVLLGALTVLATALQWLSQLSAMLFFMPLVSLFVIYTSLGWTLALVALMVLEGELIAAHLDWSLRARIGIGFDFLPSSAFVIVFTHLMLRERQARQRLRFYAAQMEQLAVTNERNRIAREIHDTVGHYLTVVHVQIEAARAILGGAGAGADECLARAEDLVRDGLTELRRSVTMLRAGSVAERPFGVALSSLVEESRQGGLATTLTIEGTARMLAPAIEFTLYRAAQEALTNVTRHAKASAARLTLRYDESEVCLRVEDDGVGATATDGGFGLTGVRERAQLVGGAVSVRTAAGAGFTLEVRVPL
jgi:signal transduction histidine kinase